MSMIATNRPGVLRRGIATNTGKNCHAICSELVDRSWNNCEASNPLKPYSALYAEVPAASARYAISRAIANSLASVCLIRRYGHRALGSRPHV